MLRVRDIRKDHKEHKRIFQLSRAELVSVLQYGIDHGLLMHGRSCSLLLYICSVEDANI